MLFLKIIEITSGVALIILGFLIYFKKKYNLANDYLYRLNKGEVNEQYAKNIGLIYLIGGAFFLIFGLLSLILSDVFTFIQYFVIIFSIVLLLLTNPKRWYLWKDYKNILQDVA